MVSDSNTKYKTGIVLSGGGARGFAHIGALKALNEKGIFPDIISAVSAGAIVGAFYADGYKPDEIFKLLTSLDLYKILKFNSLSSGLLRAEGIQDLLQQHLHKDCLEELSIPLIISATNLNKARTDFFKSGNIVDAVLASSAIPMVLKPYTIKGEVYVDGGVMNNLPVEPLLNICEKIIGINVNPIQESKSFNSLRNLSDRLLHLAIRANIRNNIEKCDLYIEPPDLNNFHLFKISQAKEIYERGYTYTIRALQKE